MPRKVRFPLEMEHGIEVRSLEELREHFSLPRVLAYVSNGKLMTWLRDRYANDLADAMEGLDVDDIDVPRTICEIFQVDFTDTEMDMERSEARSEKLRLLMNAITKVVQSRTENDGTHTGIYLAQGKPSLVADQADVGGRTSHKADGTEFHMRLAPAARFPMGKDDHSKGIVDTPFWIAETLVTYELWYAVRKWSEDHGYGFFANYGREGSKGTEGLEPSRRGKHHPVTKVSWYDSVIWCNALSEMLGYEAVYTDGDEVLRDTHDEGALEKVVVEDTNGFRLPTSEEWELAARYIDGSSWTPGEYASGAIQDTKDSHATGEVAWYSANTSGTKPVGQKKANGLRIYDMSGNVNEWCFTQSGSGRVRRGGSWSRNTYRLQVGNVFSIIPGHVNLSLGLRLARTYTF